jgi:hypothetical protein
VTKLERLRARLRRVQPLGRGPLSTSLLHHGKALPNLSRSGGTTGGGRAAIRRTSWISFCNIGRYRETASRLQRRHPVENQRNDRGDMGRNTGGNYGGGSTGTAGSTDAGATGMGGSMSGGMGGGSRESSEGGGAADTMDRAASGLRDQFSGVMDYFRENGVQDMLDDMTSYVKTHPTQALVGAAVLGFFAGRMARRS